MNEEKHRGAFHRLSLGEILKDVFGGEAAVTENGTTPYFITNREAEGLRIGLQSHLGSELERLARTVQIEMESGEPLTRETKRILFDLGAVANGVPIKDSRISLFELFFLR